jgi:hypothetical protein
MRHIIYFLLIGFALGTLFANPMLIEGEYKYIYSDSESIVDAKRKCFDFAKKDALEKFATYISSESVVKNYQTEKDEIISSTMGIIKNIQVVEEKIDKLNNSIYYKVTAEVNEQEILNELRKKYGTAELKIKVTDLITTGDRAEKELRIGEALRNFYWALLMLKSDPAGSNLKCEQYDPRLLSIVLPEKIESIFADIKYEIADVVESMKYKGINLDVKYRGKPVKSLDFKYFNGEEWSKSIPARDGRANVDLYGDAANVVAMLLINTEYKYEDMAYHNESVKEVMATSLQIPFQGSTAKLAITSSKPKQAVTEEPKTPVVQQGAQPENKQPTNAAERFAQRNRELQNEKDKKQTQTQPQTHVKQPAVPQKAVAETKKETQPFGVKRPKTEMNIYFSYTMANGDFANNERYGDLIDELFTQGFVSGGFGLGMMVGIPVADSGFRINVGFDMFFSGVDEGKFEEWAIGNEKEYYYFNNDTGYYESFPGYIVIKEYEVTGIWLNMPMYIGAGYRHYFNEKISLSANANVGFNLSTAPDYKLVSENWWNPLGDSGAGSWYYSWYEYTLPTPSFSMMYSAGIGFSFYNVELSSRYMILGKHQWTMIMPQAAFLQWKEMSRCSWLRLGFFIPL